MASSLSIPFLEQVRREKEGFWRKHSHISEKEREHLWSLELLSASHPTSPDTNHAAFGIPPSGQDVPRSFSSGNPSPNWHNTGFLAHAPVSPSQLKRDYSQQSAPAAPRMMRSSTQSSSSGDGFYGSSAPTQASSLMQWAGSYDDPPNAYTLSAPRPHRAGSGHRGLQQVAEQVLEDPGNYLARMDTETDFSTPGPPQLSLTTHTYNAPNKKVCKRRSVCSEPAAGFSNSYGVSLSPQYPTPPLSTDLTNDTTVASQMSRHPSGIGSSVCGQLDMLRMSSCISSDYNLSGDPAQVDLTQSFDKSSCNSAPFSEDSSFHHDLRYIGGVGDAARHQSFQIEYLTSTSLPSSQSTTKEVAEEMTRSDSNSSASSKSSLKSNRSQARLLEVTAAQASRPLAPKESDDHNMSRQVSVKMVRVKSTNGCKEDDKLLAEIEKNPKAHYTRPKHERVYCKECTDHPDGFRGDHELRRHVDRVHTRERTVWLTVDYSAKENPALQPKLPLASCKTCRTGKMYNQYYNAAAHLRRAHFNPKKNRKGKGMPADEERRGGKGGGDKPSMEVLKNWMKETKVLVRVEPPEESSSKPEVATATAESDSAEPESVSDYGDDQGTCEASSSYNNKMEVTSSYGNYSETPQAVYNPSYYDWQAAGEGQFDDDIDASTSLYLDTNQINLFNLPHQFSVNEMPLNEATSFNDENFPFSFPLQNPPFNVEY